MRIAQVHWAALPTTGGVETHLEALVHGLRSAGHEVTYVAGTPQARTAEYHPALRPGGVPDADGDLDRLTAALGGCELVHVHNPQWHRPETVDRLLDALDLARWPGTWVFGVHNLAEDERHATMLRRWTVERHHRLVAHSPFVAGTLRATVAEVDVRVLPLALPADDVDLPSWDTGPVVLQPTRLSAWKGSHLSLAVAVDLLTDGYQATFVHAGSEHLLWHHGLDEELLARVGPWREKGRIRFVHYLPEQSWAAIRAADLVLHPTAGTGVRGEPYSMSVAQALLCGRPVVVSRSGNLPDLVRGYPAARLVDPGDLAGLRAAVAGFLAGEWPAAAEPAAAEPVAALRAWHDGAVRRHEAFYQEVLR
jgi:glycosyltransferase involved in cell wall biosynthesis